MPNLDSTPWDSAAPKLFAEYPADSRIGIELRKADARQRLEAIDEVEEATREVERIHAQITDRVRRMIAQQDFEMEYLLRFGVRADEREMFRVVLKGVAEHGRLSLGEAADLAQSRQILDSSEHP